MKRFTNSFLVISTLILFSFTAAVVGATIYKLDAKSSKIAWSVTDQNGNEQSGTLKFKSGNLQIDSKRITGGFFYINLQSLKCTSIEDLGFNKDLVDWMRNDSNFNALKQKEIKVKITKAMRKDVDDGEDNFEITAIVDIKGVKQSINFPAMVKFGKKTNLIAEIDIKGTDFDMEQNLSLSINVNALKP